MMGNFATTVLLLALLCVDLACGLVFSGPPLVSPPPSPSATTYNADSRLYLSYSPPSSLAEGVATWLATRQPNQSIRPFVPTSVPNAQTDTSQDAVPDWKEQWGSFAGVATDVSAFATSVATGGGIAMALRMDGRETGRDEREEGRDEREKRQEKREKGRDNREKRWRVEDRNREKRWRVEDRNREERWRVEDRNREERWRVEDRKSQRQTALTSCTLTLLIICLFMLYFATSDSYFDYLFK